MPPKTEVVVSRAPFPVNYVAARKALSECVHVDEVKEFEDRAVAVGAYAKQINDRSLFDLANRIRLRATRRLGELLKRMTPAERKATGLKQSLVTTAMRVLKIPEKRFEREVEVEQGVPNPAQLGNKYHYEVHHRVHRFQQRRRTPEEVWEDAYYSVTQYFDSVRTDLQSMLNGDYMNAAVAVSLANAEHLKKFRQQVEALRAELKNFELVLRERERQL